MFTYSLIHHPESFSLDQKIIERICRDLYEYVEESQNGIINIAFLPDKEIQVLNHTYRNIDKTTDVLSFHYFDDFSSIRDDEIAGEIILSESRVLDQASEHDHAPERESYILILHGLLHILGYDHETDDEYREMLMIEQKLREAIKKDIRS